MQTRLKNALIAIGASILFYLSPITFTDDPILIVGYSVVYLELSKLLYIALTGADAPILIRYVFAAIAVGAAIKVYESMVIFNPDKILIYGLVAYAFTILRWIAITSTKDGR